MHYWFGLASLGQGSDLGQLKIGDFVGKDFLWLLKVLSILSCCGNFTHILACNCKHKARVGIGDSCMSKKTLTRTNCSRMVHEIESGSWETYLGWWAWRMIICKRPIPPDDHLQKAGSSGWSFASGRNFQMIICKKADRPDDHLQVAGPSRWSFAKGRFFRMIMCKRQDPPYDH